MDRESVKVRPNQLRFSQDSIADHFKLGNGKEFLLKDALSDLRSNRLKASDFPLIEVAKDENGVLWSNDNRRLWLFRKAQISTVEVNLYSRPLFRAPPEPHLRERMGKDNYFPRVRKRPLNAQRNPPSQQGKKAPPPVFSCGEEVRSEQERRAPPVFSRREEVRSAQERRAPPVFSYREEVRAEQRPPETPSLGEILILAALTVLIWGVRKLFGFRGS
ncbi:hypothetical protein SUGI_1072220 [Cryptomeria japonica]|nr:hypothetical protein SUGI_1072220 [Cryptomeria japonica]